MNDRMSARQVTWDSLALFWLRRRDEDKFQEFKRYSWENKRTMDSAELSQVNAQSALEGNMLLMKREYFKKLIIVNYLSF